MAISMIRAAPVRTRLTSDSECVVPSGKIISFPPLATASATEKSWSALCFFESVSSPLTSEERIIGRAPEALIRVPRTGTLNRVCLAISDIFPGRVAIISIGSINPEGCQAMKTTPPSEGMFSSSTTSTSLNHTWTISLASARMLRYVRPGRC